jgi:hypothetical protein
MTNHSYTTAHPFNIAAVDLIDVIDSIANGAMEGLKATQKAISELPVEARPVLNQLTAYFRAIGHAADATVADCNADLAKVWGVTA